MKYVDFYGHKVSKLICGDIPFNGHSYITDYISGKELVDFHTEDKILEAYHKMEEMGINTILPLSDPYILRILKHYRNNGGKMNFIFQLYCPMLYDVSFDVNIRLMNELEPIGVYTPGSTIDVNFEEGNFEEIERITKKLRDNMDCKVGIGTHHPELIEYSLKEGWDYDFYMACLYDFRRGLMGEKSGFITGKSKSSIQFVESDREVMLEALKKVEKPVLAFKLFGGGKLLCGKEEAERKAQLTEIYDTVFNALKPDDIGVIGVFQKYHDQIAEDISVFNEWAEGRN